MPRPRRATPPRKSNIIPGRGGVAASRRVRGLGLKQRGNAMDIHLAGSRPTKRAPKEWFTGTVLQDPIIATEAPARLAATRGSFAPGARTAWHSHPLGQT